MSSCDFTYFTTGLGFMSRTLKSIDGLGKTWWLPAVEYLKNVKGKYDPNHADCTGRLRSFHAASFL